MEARRTKRLALGFIVFASVVAAAVAASPAPSTGRGLSIGRAETAARKAVLEHPSYRRIDSTRSGLVTRTCRRAHGSSVRCALYTVAPSPCALDGETDTICAQALWERRWLVQVTRGPHGAPAAHILKISSGPSGRDLD